MNNIVNSQKGITLVALVITIIVLLILAGIGFGELSGNTGDINQTKDTIALAELDKVQQAVLETYIKYKQMGNVLLLIGNPIEYSEAKADLADVAGNEVKLKITTPYDNTSDAEFKYYELTNDNLKTLGLENIHNNDKYVVNYSTGEVFNITQKKTAKGEALYIYAKDNT